MKIIAGLGYDNRLPNHPPQLLGCQLCGEQGLISALELRAGIASPDSSQAARTVAYLKALKAADDGNRFYSQSLATDPMASAEALLAWRDWAILHGWKYDSRSASHDRMADLEAAEARFSQNGSSLGERIYALLPRLRLLSSSISDVELHHSRASWPPLYQHLFEQLEKAGVQLIEAPIVIQPQAPADSDLGKLQRALSDGSMDSLDLQQDGSVRLFSAASEELAAQYVIREANSESLIIAPNAHHCLETVITQLGGNHSGLGDLSNFRAPNQLLLLMLQCAWKTPSADALLQFLSLSAGRFQRLRRSLARRFRDLPGFDQEHWDKEINDFVAAELRDKPDLDEQALRSSAQEWLPICLCKSDEAMPIELAVSLTDRVANYWKALLSMTDQEQAKSIFAAAFSAADAVSQALREWPETDISKVQLNRLLSMTVSMGNSRFREIREVSQFDLINNAEVAPFRTIPVGHTLWINPSATHQSEAPPLSKQELSGIPLAPDPTQQSLLAQMALQRAHAPILAATQSLTLITTSHSPDLLKLHLSSLVGNHNWRPLENAIVGNEYIKAATQPISEFNLPQAQRWWDLDCSIPAPRSTESYSSLATLALRPHEYALKYAAQIREGAIESLAADARLKGNLAHHLVEDWFTQHPWNGTPISRSTISSWLDTNLPIMIRRVALPLAQPGMQAEQLNFQQQMLDAMDKLLQAMFAAKITSVESERRFEYDGNLGRLIGTMDLFCALDDGRFAIIDMKWGGYNKYRDELKEGRPLQLATYAHIAENSHPCQLADAGYFILSRGELLCNHTQTFPTATAIEPDDPTSLQLTWQKFEAILQWRIEQLQGGRIELTYGSALPDNDSAPPVDTPSLISLEDKARKQGKNSYRASFKAVDTWRNLTGNIKEH